MKALLAFFERKLAGKLFDLMPNGEIVGWEFKDLVRR